MSQPYVAEIRIFGFNFAPIGWAQCNGQLISIQQNTALFSLLGISFGGNGQSTFALPNLQGSAPLGWGQGPGLSSRDIGQTGGVATVALSAQQMPAHTHPVECNTAAGNTYGPALHDWAQDAGGSDQYAVSGGSSMSASAISIQGGGQAHNNLQPYLVLNFCIALQGVYPPRS
jgi:microcystin-dependent protein